MKKSPFNSYAIENSYKACVAFYIALESLCVSNVLCKTIFMNFNILDLPDGYTSVVVLE